MPLRVNNNIAAINTQRSINRNSQRINRQLERLSSGLRVNRASDDASGLVVSEGMRAEVAGLNQNVRNAEQAFNLLQVAEGSMQEVNNILVRMRELSIQSATSTINDKNRESLASEFNQLTNEIDRIAQATTYNSSTLLTGFGSQVGAASTAVTTSNDTGVTNVALSSAEGGTFTFVDTAGDSRLTLGNGQITQTLNTGTLLDNNIVASGTTAVANFDRLGIQVTLAGAGAASATGSYVDGDLNSTTIEVQAGTGGIFQVGPSASFVNRIEVGISDMRSSGNALNLDQLSISSLTTARQSVTGIDQAVSTVADERGKLGAVQNRLFFAIAYSENEIENIQASEAIIRDADVAAEVTEFSRAQILLQAGHAMLSQANANTVQALTLL
jgi:flagellin